MGYKLRFLLLAALAALAAPAAVATPVAVATEVPLPEVVAVPAGPFFFGSGRPQREAAYRMDEAAYGHSETRQQRWYESESDYRQATTPAFAITGTPITNAQYHAFVVQTGHRLPDVTAKTWSGYGLNHPYSRTRRHAWADGAPPPGREEHPVVLVALEDARAYAAWLGAVTGHRWRLPREIEWEKAARGTDGRWFPWGLEFDPSRLNSHDGGPFDTMPVGSFPEGASPVGMLDAAGQVFEWTATAAGEGRHIVKGGSWDDSGCGVCRAAARHSRPDHLKHILIGFRLVRE